tara:strand:+ start:390 stop:659 length:270 start_codon:yes stop_codon:yes gene_type:complete
MDNKFLDKVIDQIVRETEIDYVKETVYNPFTSFPLFFSPFSSSHFSFLFNRLSSYFTKHCKNIYGLNEDETEYVWDEYKKIIKDKIDGL